MAKRKASGARKAASSSRKASTSRKKSAPLKKKPGARKSASKSKGRSRTPAGKALKKAAKPARGSSSRRRPAARKAAPKKAPLRSKKADATKGRARKPRPQKKRPTREETIPGPPSSLDMNRRGSAARTGRDEMAEDRADHANMTPSITGGDVDANVEDAYFTGDEAPGGDNSTPDQDIVDDIGRALGVEYQDNEELRASDKVADRDKHRWELDPASSEDYRDRK
jgi:Family of unknown function (DUF6335)